MAYDTGWVFKQTERERNAVKLSNQEVANLAQRSDIGIVAYLEEAVREAVREAVCEAVQLSNSELRELNDPYFSQAMIELFKMNRRPEQGYVRGIFCGGKTCDEVMVCFRAAGIPFKSNSPLSADETLEDAHRSEGNTFIDMGDDCFTKGELYPLIEPSLRNRRIVNDALRDDTAVMLVDVVLGLDLHPDPAGVVAEAAREAQRLLQARDASDGRAAIGVREVLWIASVIDTRGDPQGLDDQVNKLLGAGFVVTESTNRAARLAASIITHREV